MLTGVARIHDEVHFTHPPICFFDGQQSAEVPRAYSAGEGRSGGSSTGLRPGRTLSLIFSRQFPITHLTFVNTVPVQDFDFAARPFHRV